MTRRGFTAALVLAVLFAGGFARAATAPVKLAAKRPPVPASKRPAAPAAKPAVAPVNPVTLASDARNKEDAGSYGLALQRLRELRGLVPLDGDLELAVALDEARAGLLDSAWVRLTSPVLERALADTGGPPRWREYPFQREPFWLNGGFDGWYWYVARVRAEVALRLGLWNEARAAALLASGARPLAGKDHLLLALCEAHAGDATAARREVDRALILDPLLPEAHYLRGLLAWRAGQRAEARRSFGAALAGDSTYRAPALALSRMLVPGLAPDPLPTRFLAGLRRAAELTSRVRPKLEEFVQNDQLATLYGQPARTVPDSLKRIMDMTKPMRLYVTVLVDERGRVASIELPWLPPGQFPESLLSDVLGEAAGWHFRPAIKLGRSRTSYATVEYQLNP